MTNAQGVGRREAALVNVMKATLRDADAQPQDVGHLHAHGLSTRSCDADEARAIQAVFGQRARQLPVTAAKSYFGNLGAGSGLIELVASILALKHGRLFKVLNYDTPDPQCPLNVVTEPTEPGQSFINVNVTPQGQASAIMARTLVD